MRNGSGSAAATVSTIPEISASRSAGARSARSDACKGIPTSDWNGKSAKATVASMLPAESALRGSPAGGASDGVTVSAARPPASGSRMPKNACKRFHASARSRRSRNC